MMTNSVPNNSIVNLIKNESIDFPFEVKRVYWITSVPDETIRGTHAHKECEELIYNLSGTVEVKLIDINGHESSITLESGQFLYIPILVWKAITFYNKAKLLVFASTEYSPQDYIYEEEFFAQFLDSAM
jgi:mannose-6-phosphate isomerase-like protein (cupin superfamily)